MEKNKINCMKEWIAEHLIGLWVIASIVFAFVIHCLFSISAKNDWWEAKWGAGDILTYVSTVSLGLLEWFDGIRFKGEILKKVFHIKGIDIERSNGSIIVSHNNDKIEYEVKTKEYEFIMCIWSKLRESHGLDGITIENSEVALDIRFTEKQPLRSIFDHYNILKDFLSFLVFRDNVDFDDIVLLKKRDGYFVSEVSLETAINELLKMNKATK